MDVVDIMASCPTVVNEDGTDTFRPDGEIIVNKVTITTYPGPEPATAESAE